jgi:MFS transporter, OFA family, oxalate/formate antiporter
LGINLALGILYSWSVIKKGIPADWNWSDSDKTIPYSTAVLVFSLMMVPAGRLQDRIGPRVVATLGGLAVGLGFILASLSTIINPAYSFWGYLIGFGVLAGSGIGFGYASATPPAVKWFPAAKTGLIAGLVVSGFGLASVYTAPLTDWLIRAYSLQHAVMVLGIAFLVVVVGLSQLLIPPPKGYVPGGAAPAGSPGAARVKKDYLPSEMLKTPQFYLCWFLYAIGAGAGLMIISQLATVIAKQADIKNGFILVAGCAIGNGGGRILAGMLSDKWGRQRTLMACFLFQAVLLLVLSTVAPGRFSAEIGIMSIMSALIGANYGANLALFPAVTKDYYGLKNFGVNYGLVFTAWGFGGFMLAQAASKVYDKVGTFTYNYYAVAALLVVAAAASVSLRPPKAEPDSP